ncbi:MAG: VOC family protein [Acidiferrobacterales bacterium]|nr:VOC family protein [Acidiferrobacterales bacterium]
MISHVMIGSNDIERSRTFYNSVLGILGVQEPMEHINDTGQKRLFYMHNGSTFSVSEPINGETAVPSNGSTIGFSCDSPEQIQELHDIAVANGATSVEDPPGLRQGRTGDMYLCYFLDPDGHKICGLHRPK